MHWLFRFAFAQSPLKTNGLDNTRHAEGFHICNFCSRLRAVFWLMSAPCQALDIQCSPESLISLVWNDWNQGYSHKTECRQLLNKGQERRSARLGSRHVYYSTLIMPISRWDSSIHSMSGDVHKWQNSPMRSANTIIHCASLSETREL
jgi:hypothetical protein